VSLNGFVGNSEVLARINGMLATDRLPHAVIIEGAEGSGRLTLAKLIARAAACTGENAPCGRCSSCLASQSPDVSVITPEKSAITVDQIRGVRNDAYIVPTQSKKRVFIIPDAQLMNPQAQNALLKVLEEPPQAAMFILTCNYTRQLLGTVVSRSAVFSLTAPTVDEAVEYILQNYPQYDEADVRSACRGGTIGDALDTLAGARGYIADGERLADLVLKSEIELHKAMKAFERDRAAQKGVAEAMFAVMHDALNLRCGANIPYDSGDVRRRLAAQLTAEQLIKLCDVCRRASADSEANMGANLFITCFCAALSAAVQD